MFTSDGGTAEDALAAYQAALMPNTSGPSRNFLAMKVNQERDRRIEAGFSYGGTLFQSRAADRENMAGAATAALAALMNGAQSGDLRWHGGDSDFAWIAADNTLVPMDAQGMFDFAQAAMAHKQAHIFAARVLKDGAEIPADFANDAYWPGAT